MSVSSKASDNCEFDEPTQRCIDRVAKSTDTSTGEIAAMVSSFFAELDHQLAQGREVEIHGFGVFVPTVSRRRARNRRLRCSRR